MYSSNRMQNRKISDPPKRFAISRKMPQNFAFAENCEQFEIFVQIFIFFLHKFGILSQNAAFKKFPSSFLALPNCLIWVIQSSGVASGGAREGAGEPPPPVKRHGGAQKALPQSYSMHGPPYPIAWALVLSRRVASGGLGRPMPSPRLLLPSLRLLDLLFMQFGIRMDSFAVGFSFLDWVTQLRQFLWYRYTD